MAPGCTNWYYRCKEKTFHRLPTNESQQKRWLQKLKLASPPSAKSARVCSDHFVDGDYKTKDTYDEQGHLVKKKHHSWSKMAKSAKKQKLLDTRLARAAAMQVNEILLSL